MRTASLAAALAIFTVPSAASAAVMVARFEGVVGGIHSTFTDRFGHPPLYSFSGPFAAEITYDTTAGSPKWAGPGAESRNAAAILDAWIGFEDVRLEIPSAQYGDVTASPTGFSFTAMHYIANVVSDRISISVNYTGAAGDLHAAVAPTLVDGHGWVEAASNYATGVFAIDLTGACTYGCGGMQLYPTRFSVSPFAVAPGPGVPEPATWAMMILGFGAAGAILRRDRRPAVA